MVIFPGFWDSNVSTRYPTRKKNPKFNMKQTTGRQNMLKMPIVFRCQSHSKIKCYHIPAIERNCLYCSGAHFCRWPGWTSEQNSAVKYLNYFMWLIRTQFEPSKYLYYNDFIQLISLSGTCRCLAIPVQVLHQWVQKTCNGISTCSHWCVVFCFFFFCCETASDGTPVFKSIRESTVAASEQNGHFPSLIPQFFFPILTIVLAAMFTKLALESEIQL